MKVELHLSFKKGALTGADFIQLFEEHVKFEPLSFTKKYTTKQWDVKKHKKVIATATNNDTIIVGSGKNDIFITTDSGTRNPHRSLQIVQEKEIFMPSEETVNRIIDRDGFIVAYLFDEDYDEVQNTPYPFNYAYRNYPAHILDSLKNTPSFTNEFGEKQFDVSDNPGKAYLIGYCWLMPAWKMWFGKLFFEIVPKQKILDFKGAYKIQELDDGKVFVQLFEKIEDTACPENMEIQKKWRSWLDFEGLSKIYK